MRTERSCEEGKEHHISSAAPGLTEDGGSPRTKGGSPPRLKVLVTVAHDGWVEVYAPREQGRLLVELVELRPEYTVDSQLSRRMHPVYVPENLRQTGFPRYIVRPNQSYRTFNEMEFDYTDETGAVQYQAVHRSDGHRCQRFRDADNYWNYDLGERRRLLYRLPELLAADPKRMVLFTTNERVTDELCRMGMVSTTCSLSVYGWRFEWFKDWLRDRNITVLADRTSADDAQPGDTERLAREMALDMLAVANTVKFVSMPSTLSAVKRLVQQTPKLAKV